MATREALSDYLFRIRAEDASFGDESQVPATNDELEILRQQARERFKYELPQAYLFILSLSNGVNFNGYTLYASKTLPITGYSDRFIEGFLEANDLWQEYDKNDDHHLLMFGENGDDLYLFDQRTQRFHVTDKVSGDVYQAFDTFEELAEQLFKEALGLID